MTDIPPPPPGGSESQPGGYSPPPPPPAPAPPAAGGYQAPPPAYAPQGSSPPPVAGQWSGPPLAEWAQRVPAFLIDNVAAGVAVAIVAIILSAVSSTLGALVWFLGGLGAFGFALYNAYLGGETGQSIGKQRTGLRLLNQENGQTIGGGMGIARYFLHIVDSIACYIGYLWPLWDPMKQTFSDKIIKTVVIKL